MNPRDADDASLPVSDRNLAANDQPVRAVFLRGRFNGVDDGHAGSHDFLIAFDVEIGPRLWMKIVIGLADKLAFGPDAAVFAAVPVPHDKAPLPVFHKKRHVRQQVKKLLERLDGIQLPEKILSELFGIHADKIHKKARALQAVTEKSANMDG
jgi:hypothetical protein